MYRNENKILSYLGLATRARKIVLGEGILKGIRDRSIKLVLICEDASENTKKRYMDKCKYYDIPCFIFSDIDSVSKAIGKSNRVCVGIIENGFADKIISMIGG